MIDLWNLLIAVCAFGLVIFWPENEKRRPKNSAAKNDSKEARIGEPEVMSKPPDYENWHPDQKEHETQERRYWRRQNRITGIGLAFSIFTFFVAIGAAYIAYCAFNEARRQTDINQKMFVASNRAWIGPVDARLDEQLQRGQEMRVVIILENSGKEPAIDVYNVVGGGFTLPFSAEEAAQQQRTGPFGGSATDACAGIAPQKGFPIIFPNTNRPLQAILQRGMVADDAVINGGRTFFVHGCVAYTTISTPHFSEYCFWLGPRIDPATGLRRFQPCAGSFRAT